MLGNTVMLMSLSPDDICKFLGICLSLTLPLLCSEHNLLKDKMKSGEQFGYDLVTGLYLLVFKTSAFM